MTCHSLPEISTIDIIVCRMLLQVLKDTCFEPSAVGLAVLCNKAPSWYKSILHGQIQLFPSKKDEDGIRNIFNAGENGFKW